MKSENNHPVLGVFLTEVHRLMAARGVSERDLVQISGVPSAAISGIYPDTVYVPLLKLPFIASGLGVHPAPLARLWAVDHANWMKELMDPPFSPFGEPFDGKADFGPQAAPETLSAPAGAVHEATP